MKMLVHSGAAGLVGLLFGAPFARAAVFNFNGTTTGSLNGVAVNAVHSATGETTTGRMVIDMTPISPLIGAAMLPGCYQTGCISWAAGTSALNLLALTGGNFTRNSEVTFSTGHALRYQVDQVRNSTTQFTVSNTFSGTAPDITAGSFFQALDFDDRFYQLSPNVVRQEINHSFLVDLDNNGTIDPPLVMTGFIDTTYNGSVQLPFEETIHGRSIVSSYDSLTGSVHHEMTMTVTPVPEPGALSMAAAALLMRRRRNR